MAMASTSTRSKTSVYLLDSTITELTGSKLPSIGMALGLFLHHHIELNKTVRESSTTTIHEIIKFWQKARIPVQELRNCQPKLEKLFEKWRLLKKNKNRNTVTQKSKEREFVSKLDNLFDIAHSNALNMIKVSQDKEFLLAQREKGRRGSMLGIDKHLDKIEKKADFREQVHLKRVQQMKEKCEKIEETVQLISSDESDEFELEEHEQASSSFTEEKVDEGKRNRKRRKVMTPYLAVALDRTQISDRKAVFVVAETAKSLGCDVEDITLSRSHIRRERMKHRSNMFQLLKTEFQEKDVKLTVHWDGKLLQNLTGKEKIDRLPIIVSGQNVHQLLTVAKLASGTGKTQAAAVYSALQDWGLADKVCAMCFDTASVNTGYKTGTCGLLEKKLNKTLFYLACRHHIMELIIGTVFNTCMGFSSAPEVLLFKRFQTYWEFMDKSQYKTGISNKDILAQVADIMEDRITFAEKLLLKSHSRDDYREFLELSLIFLGKTPPRGIRFMAPGAMHHARWMSKILYCLKIWMFSCQFTITVREEKGLQKICVFVIRVYLKAWMTASLPQNAPYNDFNLMKSLLQYKKIDEKISKVASEKLGNHLWYLSEDLVALALFDNEVNHCIKRQMIKAMEEVDGKNELKKPPKIKLQTFMNMKFEDFVTKRSITLFQTMNLPDSFLNLDPQTWEKQTDYCKALKIIKEIQVVNDHAERGVSLIKEFNGKITQSEDQLQFLLQVIEEHRRLYPDCKKKSLASDSKRT